MSSFLFLMKSTCQDAVELFRYSLRVGDLSAVQGILAVGGLGNLLEDHQLAIRSALAGRDVECMRTLLDRLPAGAINMALEDDNTALHLVVKSGDFAMVSLLLQNGASPNAQNSVGFSPLHIACTQKNSSFIPLLIAYGANPDLGDHQGHTAAYWAAITGNAHYFPDKSFDPKPAMAEAIARASLIAEEHCLQPTAAIVKSSNKSSKATKKK